MNVVRRKLLLQNFSPVLNRTNQSIRPKFSRVLNHSTSTNNQKPFTFLSRPFLFTGSFLGLYQTIAAGTSLCAYLYFHYTDSSTHFLGGSAATYLLRLRLPFTNDERTVGDLLDTALRRAMTASWTWVSWKRWTKDKGESKEEKQKVVEDVLDNLEGPDSPARKRWKQRLSETGIVIVPAEDGGQGSVHFDTEKFGGWKDRQIERVKAIKVHVPSAEELRRTAQDWKDKVKTVDVYPVLEPQQGALKKLTDAAAAYVVLKALFPVRLGAALLFTPRVARWAVAAWRKIS